MQIDALFYHQCRISEECIMTEICIMKKNVRNSKTRSIEVKTENSSLCDEIFRDRYVEMLSTAKICREIN